MIFFIVISTINSKTNSFYKSSYKPLILNTEQYQYKFTKKDYLRLKNNHFILRSSDS